MKNELQIVKRIDELRSDLTLLEKTKSDEMGKRFNQRDYRLLKFISKERDRYQFAIDQLEWMLNE
jgi:hypothetical protein